MQIESQIANVIWTVALFVALYFAWDLLVVPILRERMRHKLFCLRRQMFLYMADGHVSPDSPAYGMLRSRINAAIRFADGLSLTRAIAAKIAIPEICKKATEDLDKAISVLSPEVKTRMDEFRKEYALSVGRFVLLRSPIVWTLVAVTLPVVIAFIAVLSVVAIVKNTWLKSWAEMMKARAWRKMDRGAEGINCLDEEILAAA